MHGLGMTTMKTLQMLKFDSVDSSNWTAGPRFGALHKFTGTEIKTHRYDNLRGRGQVLGEYNFFEWVKFANYAENNM